MTGINEIVFVDDDGFDFNDGEKLIRFDNVTYYKSRLKLAFLCWQNLNSKEILIVVNFYIRVLITQVLEVQFENNLIYTRH